MEVDTELSLCATEPTWTNRWYKDFYTSYIAISIICIINNGIDDYHDDNDNDNNFDKRKRSANNVDNNNDANGDNDKMDNNGADNDGDGDDA